MCKTCGGKGHINIDYGWGYGFYPCPDSQCDYDLEKTKHELGIKYKKKLQQYGVVV